MAKISFRHRSALDNPEEVLTLAQSLWEKVKPYTKFLVLGGIVIAVGLAAWEINARMQAAREERAAEALTKVQPQLAGAEASAQGMAALEQFIKEFAGTRAAWEAGLLRANLLYQAQKYAEAAKAYEALPQGRDPGWNALIAESLSYCYEGLGDFKKAAEVLQPVVERTSGPLHGEVMRRLALLYDQAKDPQQAVIYWRKLLEQPPDPSFTAYLKEKLAASEAKLKK